MNLVRGALQEKTTTPRSHAFLGRRVSRSTARGATELGHTAGAYSRMDEDTGIKLQGLRAGDVLKTTTTEVRVNKIHNDSLGPEDPRNGARCSSMASSEMHIIEPQGKVDF